jgi:hypothetical protein
MFDKNEKKIFNIFHTCTDHKQIFEKLKSSHIYLGPKYRLTIWKKLGHFSKKSEINEIKFTKKDRLANTIVEQKILFFGDLLVACVTR